MSAPREPSTGSDGGETAVGMPTADRWVILLGFPLLGLAAALLLPPVARWLAHRPIPLMRIVFVGVGQIDRPWEVGICAVGAVLVGAVLALLGISESLGVTVGGTRLRVQAGDWGREIDRADVSAVFVDGKTLVVLDSQGRQTIREPYEGPGQALRTAFTRHGYPWLDQDPHQDLFRRWTTSAGQGTAPDGDTAELQGPIEVILAARRQALRRRSRPESRRLREAVEELGVVIRDRGIEQEWRPLVRP